MLFYEYRACFYEETSSLIGGVPFQVNHLLPSIYTRKVFPVNCEKMTLFFIYILVLVGESI